jgi:hypothetical protein
MQRESCYTLSGELQDYNLEEKQGHVKYANEKDDQSMHEEAVSTNDAWLYKFKVAVIVVMVLVWISNVSHLQYVHQHHICDECVYKIV